MKIRFALSLFALLLSAAFGFAADRPNVVFILADDLGWSDLGCYGSTFYQTPNLDELAKQGTRFTQAYAACNVCSPTRASIMTGKYPARLNLTDFLHPHPKPQNHKLKEPEIAQHLPLAESTLAEALKAGGYQTAFLGKWHLGGPGFYPEQQGFDLNIGGCELGHPPSYFSPYHIPNLPDGPAGEYLNERLANDAVKFMAQAAKKDQPFFLYFSEYAVHTPLQAKADSIKAYKDKAAKLAPSDHPEFIMDNGHRVRQVQNHPVYAAMVGSMDDTVGRVLEQIKTLGIESNTIVIFTSDNGGLSTSEGWPTSNLPLRGGKGWPYEGGVREPMIVKWPGVTKPNTTCEQPVISTDFYPTILQMAGLPLQPEQHMDGISIVPALKEQSLPERALFWHFPHYSNQGGGPEGAIHEGDWKLIEWYDGDRVELFNLKDDIGEQHDLASSHPEKVKALLNELHDWRSSVNAQMPTPNPNRGKSEKRRKAKLSVTEDDND